MKIDYSALSHPVTKHDIDNFEKSLSKEPMTKMEKITEKVVYVIIGIAMIYIFWSFIFVPTANGGFNIFPLIFLIIVPMSLLGAFFSSRKRTEKLTRLYKFAVANGIRFMHDTSDPAYPGLIFEEGDSRTINEALEFPDGTEIGNYSYTTRNGKSTTVHEWSYARIKLTRRLPHMVLDAKQNNLFGKFSSLPAAFNKEQTLLLEGDFNDFFTLYAPKEYERDALYVFTPDVMAALIDAGQSYDMEVIDDNLFLYTEGHLNIHSETQLSTMLGILDKIGAEIHDQTDYYADERIGDRAVNLVAEPGRRLASKVSIVAVIFLIVFAFLFLLNFWRMFTALL